MYLEEKLKQMKAITIKQEINMPTTSKHIKIKQILWFIALWCLGFFGLLIVSGVIRFMMSLAGLHS